MRCPRCGFDPAPGAECPACGVVFARLRQPAPRSAKPRPRPAARRLGPVLLPLVLLLPVAWWLLARPGPGGGEHAARQSPPAASLPAPAVGEAEAAHAHAETGAGDDVPGDGTSPAPESTGGAGSPVVAASAPAGGPPGSQGPSGSVLAAQLIESGDFGRAATQLELAIAQDPGDDSAALLLAIARLRQGRTDDAARALARVSAAGRSSATWHATRAAIHYARQELAEALAAYRAARALAADPAFDQAIARIERELGAPADRSVSGRRFQVAFAGAENIAAARLVLDELERAFAELAPELGVPAVELIAVLYGDQDYRRVTGAPDWSAGLFDGKIRLPVKGLRAIDPAYRTTIRHELVHALVQARGGAGVPRWLHEGLAQRYSGRRLGDFRLSRPERAEVASAAEAEDPRLYYAQALARVDYVLSRHGRSKLLALLDEMGRGASFDDALVRLTATSPGRFAADYARWAAAGGV